MPYILLTFTLFFYMPALFPALLYCILWYILLLKYCILDAEMSCTESGTLNRHQVPTVHLRLKHTAIAFPLA